MEIIESELLRGVPDLVFGMSTRNGGVSRHPFGMNVSFRVGDSKEDVKRNREMFLTRLGIGTQQLATPGQVHSDRVVLVSEPGSYPECDALLAMKPGLFVGVTVADCVPVMLVDPGNRAVGAVHAGWRGAVAGIAGKAVEMMQRVCGSDPRRILAYLGPSAGACCYEVGEEVASYFHVDTVHRRGNRVFLDVRKASILQLVESGVKRSNIEESSLCTITERGMLHSYRRDGDSSGRMMAVVGFRA